MIWLLVGFVAVLWLCRRRRPQVVVIVIQPGDDGGDGEIEPGPVTDRDVHDWISG